MKQLLLFLACLIPFTVSAQSYAPAKTNWQDAGYKGVKPSFTQAINILNYGADATGNTPCGTALTAAINALGGAPGVIYFPAGTYFFNTAIIVNRDSIVFRGAGYDSTRLRFNLSGQYVNLINIVGTSVSDTSFLNTPAVRGSSTATAAGASALRTRDWVTLSMNDLPYITSPWAYGSVSQVMQIQRISGDTITFSSPFRFNYTNIPILRKMTPRNNVGIECLSIRRSDATATQASNIVFDRAVNCWVNGIESDSTNFAHIEINHSSNIEVTNSYIHNAFAYGGGGQGYGVLLQFGSNECKVEANYFNRLRHSMVLQIGANGNVLGYNYSTNPFWTEPGLPDSSAGDIMMIGDFPFMNLAEGNFLGNIVISDSHGKNGPLNTFFRNRADLYGIFMNFNPATDSTQFIGNEVTNNQIGLLFVNGTGHFLYGNNYRGSITSGSDTIPDTSLYLPPGQKPPCAAGYSTWPAAGSPGKYNTGTIYAKARVLAGKPASCTCVPVSTTAVPEVTAGTDWTIYPNPADQRFGLKGKAGIVDRVEVYNMAGVRVIAQDRPVNNIVPIGQLAPGMYIVRIIANGETTVRKLIRR